MRNSFKRAAMVAVAAASVFIADGASAQVAVIDPAAIAQMMEQVTQMTAQLEQAKLQYKALTGSNGLGGLLSNQTMDVMGEIPNSAKAYINGSSAPSANSDYGQMQSQLRGMGRTDAMTYAANQRKQKASTDRAMIQQSLDRQTKELQNIQNLMAQIDQSTSAKDIADLQARIQASQNTLTIEQNQLQAMKMMQANRDRQNADTSEYAAKRWALGDDNEEPTSPSILGH